ncbi:hypothetical protein Q4512_01700 [Oceanihabitans sp. 2_MG-2023]|uniref:hypothetical protein n=1 Tax=Oceanihabitans sp. 2_MG-2023 TaxID=3062661 RepID=UPI0026E38A44|nr:hypothetical protein [Oceanihabitans sp. 2_MG-2023]MDO6595607.1 hypothetical protein [Oceanihabitans sp. 2_MG-2023]
MKKPTNKPAFIPNLVCSVFGHKFEVSKKVTYHVKEYKCCNCHKQMTTNSNGNLIPLTPKFEQINSVLERIYNNKATRLQEKSYASSIS